MRKRFMGIALMLCFAMLFSTTFAMAADEKKQERIVEEVTVTNVEVPVRVLYKGKPAAGLTVDDFEVFDGKKKMKIHAFFEKKKTIKLDNRTAQTGTETGTVTVQPRTYVLVFSITDFNKYLNDAVEHLFENILHTNDRVLIFANDQTFDYPNLKDKAKAKAALIKGLKKESLKARMRLLNYIKRVEQYINIHDFRLKLQKISKSEKFDKPSEQPSDKLLAFLKKFLLTWKEYKKRYLTPRVDRFYYFSRYLEKIKGEKWVLNFYQFELFPRIRPGGRAMDRMRDLATELTNSNKPVYVAQGRLMETILKQLEMELNVTKSFPVEEISKLFYKVNATFHSFFIRTQNKQFTNDLEYNEVSSDIEKTLKSITDITGGRSITSNNLVESLDTVREVEDVYYVLTYVPLTPNKRPGKIKVKCKKGRKYKTFYDDNFRVDYINDYLQKLESQLKTPDIAIDAFSFKRKILAFTVDGYLMKKTEGGTIGSIKVRIRLFDKENKSLFDNGKHLTAQKTELKLNLPFFKKLGKGEYKLILDAHDLFTGKTVDFHQNLTVK
ncbi:MAG: hypothetical protein GY757_05060 [bacterium]|nr:hypothetical protein [bacterium]